MINSKDFDVIMKKEKLAVIALIGILILIVIAVLIVRSAEKSIKISSYTTEHEIAQVDIAPPNGGVISYEVPLNSKVKKGQKVLKINPSQYTAQADADKAKLFNDEQIYNRELKLSEESNFGAVSEEDLYSSMYNVKQDEALLEVDESYVKQCVVKAPFDGTVTKIINYKGSGVGNGNEIMDITSGS